MRYRYEEYSQQNKKQYVIAVGVHELRALLDAARVLQANTPGRTEEQRHLRIALASSIKGLNAAIKVAEANEDDGKRRKPYVGEGANGERDWQGIVVPCDDQVMYLVDGGEQRDYAGNEDRDVTFPEADQPPASQNRRDGQHDPHGRSETGRYTQPSQNSDHVSANFRKLPGLYQQQHGYPGRNKCYDVMRYPDDRMQDKGNFGAPLVTARFQRAAPQIAIAHPQQVGARYEAEEQGQPHEASSAFGRDQPRFR